MSTNIIAQENKKADISKIISLFSMVSVAVALLAALLLAITGNHIFDTIMVTGLVGFILPAAVMQVVLTAGVYGPNISLTDISKAWFWVFYLLIFPFCNLFLFAGINELFQIFPRAQITDTLLVSEYMKYSWLSIGVMYFGLIAIGLIWKKIRANNKRKLQYVS